MKNILKYCSKHKWKIAWFIAIIGCGIILVDWKLISHTYPNRRQWSISFITTVINYFFIALKEQNDESNNSNNDVNDVIVDFKDPFLG